MTAALSVIIPAHNEAVVLEGLLAGLAADDALEIVVAANGCTDDTVDVARSSSPRVLVIELADASKISALNAGDATATAWPRAYVDADVRVSGETLTRLADRLQATGALAGAPRLVVDLSASSRAVRWYYSVWELTDYRRTAPVGSGVYMLSREGRSRFEGFPELIADDLFVQRLFEPAERLVPTDLEFTVRAPRRFGDLLHRAERIALGNLQLAAVDEAPAVPGASAGQLAARVGPRPSLWLPFIVYCIGYLLPRRRAARRWRAGAVAHWNRDDSTRAVA